MFTKGVFNAFRMDKKEGLAAIADQHPFAEDHGGAGIDADPIPQPQGLDALNPRREELKSFGRPLEGPKDMPNGLRVGVIDHNPIHSLFENAQGRLSFLKALDFKKEIVPSAQQVLQRNDLPVRSP